MTNFLSPQSMYVAACKTHTPKLCKPPTCFAVVKTHSPNLYKPPTCFAVVKTHSAKLCKPPTSFAVVKTHFPKLYKPPTHFAALLLNTSSDEQMCLASFYLDLQNEDYQCSTCMYRSWTQLWHRPIHMPLKKLFPTTKLSRWCCVVRWYIAITTL